MDTNSKQESAVPVARRGISWGWKIVMLYGGFVVLIMVLVIASNRQHFDLVSKDYYEEEIGYQKVIDAGKNQSSLSSPIGVHANANDVTLDFPPDFRDKGILTGNVQFYSPVNADWDRKFDINVVNNSMTVARSGLKNTRYVVKVNCSLNGKNYYQESEIMLHS